MFFYWVSYFSFLPLSISLSLDSIPLSPLFYTQHWNQPQAPWNDWCLSQHDANVHMTHLHGEGWRYGVKGNWARRGKAEKAKLSKAANEGVRESVISWFWWFCQAKTTWRIFKILCQPLPLGNSRWWSVQQHLCIDLMPAHKVSARYRRRFSPWLVGWLAEWYCNDQMASACKCIQVYASAIFPVVHFYKVQAKSVGTTRNKLSDAARKLVPQWE